MQLMTQRAVFLDRDGVLNRAIVRDGKPLPPQSLDEFEIFPDVPEAVRRLRQEGFRLVVVTNQPDVARGVQRREVVESLNRQLTSSLPLDAVEVCYHDDVDGCECRKPKPGLLLNAATRMGIDTRRSYVVGDRWRDIGAGRAAGCYTILVDRGYGESQQCVPDRIATNLARATDWILRHVRLSTGERMQSERL